MAQSMVISYYGSEKCGKTTFGFTSPLNILHFDFDLGRERAIWRFRAIADKIITIPLPEPPNWAIGSGAATKLWADFEKYYEMGLKDPQIKTLFVDTGTQMWKADTQEYLENYVRRANPKRVQLQQIEYRMPNDRMAAKIKAAKQAGKILVISHYQTDIREERFVQHPDGTLTKESVVVPGQTRHAGFGDIVYLVDIHLELFLRNMSLNGVAPKLRPWARILTPNPLEAYGIEIPEPSYDNLMMVLDGIRMSVGQQ